MEGEVHILSVFGLHKSSEEKAYDHVGEITDMIIVGKRVIFEGRNRISAILVWEKEITPTN